MSVIVGLGQPARRRPTGLGRDRPATATAARRDLRPEGSRRARAARVSRRARRGGRHRRGRAGGPAWHDSIVRVALPRTRPVRPGDHARPGACRGFSTGRNTRRFAANCDHSHGRGAKYVTGWRPRRRHHPAGRRTGGIDSCRSHRTPRVLRDAKDVARLLSGLFGRHRRDGIAPDQLAGAEQVAHILLGRIVLRVVGDRPGRVFLQFRKSGPDLRWHPGETYCNRADSGPSSGKSSRVFWNISSAWSMLFRSRWARAR